MKFLNKAIIWVTKRPAFYGVIFGIFLSLLVNRLTPREYQVIDDSLDYSKNNDSSPVHILETRTVAQQLFNEVKIACLVFPKNTSSVNQLRHIFQTWGKRCNRFIAFVQHHKNVIDIDTTNNFSTVYMAIGTVKRDAWRLTVMSFLYLNKTKMLDEYDWFLRTDTNSYIVMENLRYHLYSQDPHLALHFDNSVEPYLMQSQQGVPSLNIWNRRAILVLISRNHTLHDVRRLIRQGSGRDLQQHFIYFPNYPSTRKAFFIHNLSQLSKYPVGFRQVTYDLMYALEYFFYYLSPYGINVFSDPLANEIGRF